MKWFFFLPNDQKTKSQLYNYCSSGTGGSNLTPSYQANTPKPHLNAMALVNPGAKEELHRNNKCLLKSQLCQPSDLLASFLSQPPTPTPGVWLRVSKSEREIFTADNERERQTVPTRDKYREGVEREWKGESVWANARGEECHTRITGLKCWAWPGPGMTVPCYVVASSHTLWLIHNTTLEAGGFMAECIKH